MVNTVAILVLFAAFALYAYLVCMCCKYVKAITLRILKVCDDISDEVKTDGVKWN